MPKQTRHSTAYSGVYFVELADDNQSFFIRYKQNGKSFEERAGRSSQGWNAEKASFLRKERISGVNPMGRYSWNSSGQMDRENYWTFSVIFEAYLRLRPDLKGRENDIYRFRNYLKENFGDRTPSEVIPSDIESFRHKLQNQQLKPATVRHVLELLRRLANYALKKRFCPGLSFKIQMPIVENQKTENLTQKQLETLLRVLDEETDKQVSNIVRLILYTGLRRGEIFSLKWNDIDFYGKTITIRSKKKEKCVEIPMNEMAEKVLAEHAHSEAKSEFVFPGRGGKKRTECKRPLLRIKKKAELPNDFRLLQGLRHVYASMLASSGEVDMETLQTLLTHKSSLMTQRYTHLREDALMNSDVKLDQEEIPIVQNDFEEKRAANHEKNIDQNRQVSHENLVEENLCLDEVEELVINNDSADEYQKTYQQEIISEQLLESSESIKFDEIVQADGASFEEEFSEVTKAEQYIEIADQSEGEDEADEMLKENELLEDRLIATETEFDEQETDYVEVDVDPIKMEVDLDEIVSAEELTEADEDRENSESKDHNGGDYYAAETLEKNEDLKDRLAATEAEFDEQETDYVEVDVDPIKMEVDLDEIVSVEEIIVFTEDLQVDETKAKNIDSVFYEELNVETSEVEKNMEGKTGEVDAKYYSEKNTVQDYSTETVGDSVFKKGLFTETEAEEEISGISEGHRDSHHAGVTPEDEISGESINVQTNEEQVIQYNYWGNDKTDSVEESGEAIEACESEFTEQGNGTQINYFTAKNTDSDYSDLEQRECNAAEIELDDCNEETETIDCIVEAEEETVTSNADEVLDDEVRVENSLGVQDFAFDYDTAEEEIYNNEAASTKGENNVKISENTEAINLSGQKSGNNNVLHSKTLQYSEKHNSIRDVKIDLELNTENETSVKNTDSSSRSSISELKKELMSLSELINSTPAKVKSSTEVQNSG